MTIYNAVFRFSEALMSRSVASTGQTGECGCGRKYVRVLLVGMTDVHLRLSDWRLVTDSASITLLCLNNLRDHFVCHF